MPMSTSRVVFGLAAELRRASRPRQQLERLLRELLLEALRRARHLRELLLEDLPVEDVHAGLRLLEAHPVLQPRQRGQPHHAALAQHLAAPVGHHRLLHRQRHVQVDRARRPRCRGSRAALTPTTVMGWPFTETVSPTTFGSAPKRRFQKPWLRTTSGMRAGRPVVVGVKTRPSAALHPQHVEEVAGDEVGVGLLGGALHAQVHDVRPVRQHAVEDVGLVPEVHVHRVGDAGEGRALAVGASPDRPGGIEHDEALRLLDGQDAQEHLVHQGEDRGVGADAEGQGEDHHEGEARVLGQGAEARKRRSCLRSFIGPPRRSGVAVQRTGKRAPCQTSGRGKPFGYGLLDVRDVPWVFGVGRRGPTLGRPRPVATGLTAVYDGAS